MKYISKGAHFSDCGKYRYYLHRIWDRQLPKVMCIGLNPSTANGEDDDPTIRNLCEFLTKNGYGGLYMLNLFALISSNPEDLRSCPDPLKDNDDWLWIISQNCEDVIFAWGSFKQAKYRVKNMVNMFPNALCLGKTSKGDPIHPLAATVWMKAECKLQPFK